MHYETMSYDAKLGQNHATELEAINQEIDSYKEQFGELPPLEVTGTLGLPQMTARLRAAIRQNKPIKSWFDPRVVDHNESGGFVTF